MPPLRLIWMTRSMAEATSERATESLNPEPDRTSRLTIRLLRATCGLEAWSVVMVPSWPVLAAWSITAAAGGSRISPTMMRSGRIRRAATIRSSWEMMLVSSALDRVRDCSEMMWRLDRESS